MDIEEVARQIFFVAVSLVSIIAVIGFAFYVFIEISKYFKNGY